MRNTLIVTHAALPHAVEKFAGVYSYAKGMGWRCSIVETASLGRGLNAAIAPYHPDGIIHEGPLYEAGRLRAAFGACPTVWLDPGKVLPFMKWRVASDPDAIARIAFDELRRGGCGDFVFVTMFPGAEWSRSRRMHFLRHAAADGLRAKTVTLAEDGGAAGGRGGRLSSAFAAMSRPVGVFAVNDRTAAGFVHRADGEGLVCGEDYLLVSVDNDAFRCENISPTLSSVEQDFHAAGYAAAEMLGRVMDGDRAPAVAFAAPRGLQRRESSRVARKGLSPRTRRILERIRARALTGDGVAAICAAEDVSRRTCEKTFMREFGRTIHDALLDVRFEEVERLLRNCHQQIEPVANLCGWKSPAHLKRMFKARYGMTMGEWRAALSSGHRPARG